MKCEPLTAAIGAEVHDLDLRDPITPELADQLRAALDEHLIIGFRDQSIDDEQQLALAHVWGTPEIHPIRRAMGSDEVLSDITDNPTDTPDRDGWHTDVTYMARPPLAAVLRAVDIPPAGGDTLWANMIQAYDNLSNRMQAYIAGLSTRYPADTGFTDYVREHMGDEVADKATALVGDGATHPIVRTHGGTGRKILFFDKAYAREIVGIPKAENEMLRAWLSTRAEDPSIQCRWSWRAGDVVVWDETATQHFGAADHAGYARTIRRLTIEGPVPS
jgi:taurine dioxygenase